MKPTLDMFLDAKGYTGMLRKLQRSLTRRMWDTLTVEEQWQRIVIASLNRRLNHGKG